MWRISNGGFAALAHPEPDWALFRQQLKTANVSRETGEVPPLVLLADEISGMSSFRRETGHLPFGGGRGGEHYWSLVADLDASLERLGPSLRGITSAALNGGYERKPPSPTKRTDSHWVALFEAGDRLMERLRDPQSLVAALDDALQQTREEPLEDALVALVPLLDELRAIAELQRGPWSRTKSLIQQHLTIRETREDGGPGLGLYPCGTDPATIVAALQDALRIPRETREWAVWLATLAGPSAETAVPTAAIVSGPIAVSGRACTGGVDEWIARVRDELAVAFGAVGEEVPLDVVTMGEPAYFDDAVLFDGEELWSRVASPPSFVARVAVRASSIEEAIAQAREALRAVYGFAEPGLPGDLRPDAIVWTDGGGWALPSITAEDLSLGVVHAPRYAARAVTSWAKDLGSPLDQDQLDLLRARALVRSASAPAEVRLMRAFASLEALAPAGETLDHAAKGLWVRSLLGEARMLLLHLLSRVRYPDALGSLRREATRADWEARVARLSASSPAWGLELLDGIDDVVEAFDPDALPSALARATRRYLTDPRVVEEAQAKHQAAVGRARRHRNLTTHGHRVSDRVLGPTVAFVADQLECAIAARSDDGPTASWLGSLAVLRCSTMPEGPSHR